MAITIIVASHNPVKIQAAETGFKRMFPGLEVLAKSVQVESGVGVQPASSEETLLGATNRAHNARKSEPQADYWIGIEGGVESGHDEMQAFAWVVVVDAQGRVGKGRSGTFFLPKPVRELVLQGKELGEADDLIFGRVNSKQENGAVGILTSNLITREILYEHAVVLALIPFHNPDLYQENDPKASVDIAPL